jgi:MFS transporter, DHA1 family, tetracycline resistance protein
MASKASLLTIFLTVFIDLLGFGIVLPLLPIFATQYSHDESGVVIGLLMSSFSAMQFLFAPLWGRVSDQVGRRPVLIVGLAGSVVFYGLFGYAITAGSLTLMFVARIGAGIAGATISTAQAYIADCTTLETRAKGMALIGAAFGLGFTFGPLFAVFALPAGGETPGPGPGYAAAALSAAALLLAIFKLPESLRPDSAREARKLFDFATLREALSVPSIAMLLAAWFLCVFSFANFESTLSLLLRDVLKFNFRQVCEIFAFIGFVLTLVQGGLVRRLSGRVSEGKMAATGAVLEVIGFALLVYTTKNYSLGLLLTVLAVIVSGFAFMTPSVNSLVSRRSDPARQGAILGVGQSVNALARIVGPAVGIPLFRLDMAYPTWMAMVLMAIGGVLVLSAARSGRDYGA